MLVCASLLVARPSPCGAVTAGRVEIKGLHSIGKKEFLDMFGIRRGSRISNEIVSNAIRTAFLKGIFEDIEVKVADGENPTVEVRVREREFIRNIDVEGDYQISRKIIRGLFPVKEGHVMRYDLLKTGTEVLRKALGSYGFPDATVRAEVVKTGMPCRVDLKLTVDTGKPLVVRKILVRITPSPGDRGRLAKAIESVMGLSEGDIYRRTVVDSDLDRIRAFLKKRGYYRPVVGPCVYERGTLRIDVAPGKLLELTVKGNSALSTSSLTKGLPFFDLGDAGDEVIGEAVDRMVSLYHKEGYPFARIAPVVTSDERHIKISFFVFEGEKIRVGSVVFRHVSLPRERLLDVSPVKVGAAYDPDTLEKEKDSLREFYGALGYLDAKVTDIDVDIDKARGTVRLVVDVEEGTKSQIGSVDITGVPPGERDNLLGVAGIKAGDLYNEVDISDARSRVVEYYRSRGYANVMVEVKRSIQDHQASISFHVTRGEQSFFGKTIIVGNRKTRYEVFRRGLAYREGQPFNSRLLAEERQKLYRLGLFSDVQVEPVVAPGNRKDVLIKVAEGDAGSVEFGFGYAEYEKFRGYLQVGYKNLWGMDRQILLRTEISSLEKRFILQYNEPWFWRGPLPLRAFFLYQNKREFNLDNKETLYKLRRYTLTAGVEKKLGENVKGNLYYEFSLVRTSDVKPDVVLTREDTGTLAIGSIKPALIYDTRDNPFNPQKGFLAGISVKEASLLFFSETNFTKLVVNASNFHKLGRRVTLALALRGGVAYSYGKTTQLPIVERFFLGGGSTVRGYAQDTLGPKGADGNPTGGNAFIVGNVELRTDVGRNIGLVPFLDMGNVWVKAGDINPADLKYTAGLGLRYATPVGPIRIDYGFKLNKEPGESNGELHFSIGHAF
ncbi:MAG: outer membrane protein assembly factor BamA [Candidatus Sulfobium sp.]